MWSEIKFILINKSKMLTTTLTTSIFLVVKWSANAFVYEDSRFFASFRMSYGKVHFGR